jgi:hypothetical protein
MTRFRGEVDSRAWYSRVVPSASVITRSSTSNPDDALVERDAAAFSHMTGQKVETALRVDEGRVVPAGSAAGEGAA